MEYTTSSSAIGKFYVERGPVGQGPGATLIWHHKDRFVDDLEIVGFHGCPFFNAALQVAAAAQRCGAVKTVTVVRVGHVHVPTWQSAKDVEPWAQYKAKHGKSGSPKVTVNGSKVIDSSALVKHFAGVLLASGATLGLPPELLDWRLIRAAGAGPIWKAARGTRHYASFTAHDPPGPPLVGVERDGLRYEDVGCTTGIFPPHDDFGFSDDEDEDDDFT